jgi:hypothetical protein
MEQRCRLVVEANQPPLFGPNWTPDYERVIKCMHFEFNQRLYDLQHPVDCNNPRVFVLSLTDTQGLHGGLGSTVSYLGFGMGVAYMENRTLVLSQKFPWHHYDKEFCGPDNWASDCYWRRLTSCPYKPEWENVPDWQPNSLHVPAVKYFAENYGPMPFYHEYHCRVPDEYYPAGTEWFRSETMHYVLQPNARVTQLVETERAAIGFPDDHKCIAMHVRHGDKVVESKFLVPFWRYMDRAETYRKKYGVSHVYLQTDNDALLRELPAFEAKGWSFSFPRIARFDYSLNGTSDQMRANWWSNLMRKVGVANFTHDVLMDIYLARECHYFIGSMSSTFSRTVWSLIIGRNQGVTTPAISVDMIWGPNPPLYPIVNPQKPEWVTPGIQTWH